MFTETLALIETTDMSTRKAISSALLVLALASGCTRDNVDKPPAITASSAPIVDSQPYWCDFMPQQAVRAITGITVPLTESKEGVPSSHGQCSLRNEYNRLSLLWSAGMGDEVLEIARKNFGRKQLSALPADLGVGLIAYTGDVPRTKPYYTMMLFRCDGKRPWISVDLSEVAKGRDPVRDLTELLRITRKRYGEIHHCTPRAT